MSYSVETEKLKLPQWLGTDHPNFTPDISEAFEKIDEFAKESATENESRVNEIDALKVMDGQLDARISKNKEEIDLLTERTTKNESDISDLQTATEKNETDYLNLKTKVDTIDDVEIPKMNEDITNTATTANTALSNANEALSGIDKIGVIVDSTSTRIITDEFSLGTDYTYDTGIEITQEEYEKVKKGEIVLMAQLRINKYINIQVSGHTPQTGMQFIIPSLYNIGIGGHLFNGTIPITSTTANFGTEAQKYSNLLNVSELALSVPGVCTNAETGEGKIGMSNIDSLMAGVVPMYSASRFQALFFYIDPEVEGDDYIKFKVSTVAPSVYSNEYFSYFQNIDVGLTKFIVGKK